MKKRRKTKTYMDKRAKSVLDKLKKLKPEKKRCTIYMKKKLLEEMLMVCEKEDQSISQIVEILLDDFLNSYKAKNGKPVSNPSDEC